MAVCPNCGKEVTKPSKILKNQVFSIEGYNCEACNYIFRKIN